jgi:glycosyltransferase involved in cell wall biosynthesis
MSKKYKVAVVAACPFPYPRGTPIRILRMAEGLAARGHEVHVITYHLGQNIEDLPFQIHRISNIPTYHKLSPGPTYQKIAVLDTLLSIKLFEVIHRAGFDVIHAHHYEGLLSSLPIARIDRIPVVFDVHTLLESELPHYSLGLSAPALQRIGKFFDRLLPHRADHIVSVTNLIRTRLIEDVGILAKDVTTIYTGIEADHFSLPTPPPTAATAQTLIYTGNLAAYQGIDLMLRAFRKILDQRPDVKLKIITSSSIEPYSKMITEMRLQNNLVIEDADYFDIPGHLHSASIALHPRVHCDGLPVKLLNYMATGRAIVSFEGSAEVLEHERTGLVVANNDVDGFANAVLRLFDDPQFAEMLGENAKSQVQEFFVWENSIRSLEAIYASLTEKHT